MADIQLFSPTKHPIPVQKPAWAFFIGTGRDLGPASRGKNA